MIKSIIFDMDGVLIDSEPIYDEANEGIFSSLGIEVDQVMQQSFIGKNSLDMWTELHSTFDLLSKEHTVDSLIEHQRDIYYNHLKDMESLNKIEGVESYIKHFKSMGLSIAVASSSPRPIIDLILARLDLNKYIDFIIDGDSVDKGKPAPDIFFRAAEGLGVDSHNCLVFEDSTNGATAAKAAGMTCVGFNGTPGHNQDLSMADIVIGEYDRINLESIVGKL